MNPEHSLPIAKNPTTQNKPQANNNNNDKRVLHSAFFPVEIFLQSYPSILQNETGKEKKKLERKKERNEPWEKQEVLFIETDY